MKVRWKNGARVRVEADVAHSELERIRSGNGGELNADVVVSESQGDEAPLHGEFEWDDQKAAHQHRLSRAREIIRCLVVVLDEDTGGKHPVRRYSAERREGPQHSYAATEDIMNDPDRRAKLIQEALMKLMQWRTQYRRLNELSIVFRAHDEVITTVGENV